MLIESCSLVYHAERGVIVGSTWHIRVLNYLLQHLFHNANHRFKQVALSDINYPSRKFTVQLVFTLDKQIKASTVSVITSY